MGGLFCRSPFFCKFAADIQFLLYEREKACCKQGQQMVLELVYKAYLYGSGNSCRSGVLPVLDA